MTLPTTSLYPTSADDSTSLLPLLANRRQYLLERDLGVDDLEIMVQLPAVGSTTVTGVSFPALIIFEGGEIVIASSLNNSSTGFLIESLEDRGILGTQIQPHGFGEKLVVGILSVHHRQLQRAIEAAQRYQGFVGADAAKPANPDPGWRYTALDTGKVYYCFVDNVWAQVNDTSHASRTGLGDDDHTQYHNDARATTWHSGLSGVHIPDGNNHDHVSSGEGSAVIRVRSGLDGNRPSTPIDGEVYYSTDLDGGTLWVGIGGAWSKLSGVPTGGIMPFDGPCPSGWTRYSSLNDRYPYGADVANVGETGGQANHTHGYTQIQQHYHTVLGSSVTSSSTGSHQHSYITGYNSGSSWNLARSSSAAANYGTSSAGNHTHSATIPSTTTTSTGGSSGTTSSQSQLPDSKEVIWCKKD